MALFITQCPHCNTSFRTRISQLQSADGMVRCGACLKIFAADDNLVPSPDLQTVSISVEEAGADMGAETDSQLPFEDVDDAPAVNDPSDIDAGIITLDLADSLPNRITPSISEHQPLWELLEEEPEPGHETQPASGDPERTVDEHATTVEVPLETPAKPSLADIHASPADNAFSTANLTAMHDFEEPLQLDWHRPPPQLGRIAGMWALALVLAAGLGMQFLWYQRDSLSQNAAFRPWLEHACDLLRCALPPLVDVRAISSNNLLIRSHTEIANALSVNLVVRNDAVFAQPFPALNLRFTTATNEVVAARQFTPEEYLTSDMATRSMMPPGAPIQIAMDILDPGSRAINYEVSFSPMFSQQPR